MNEKIKNLWDTALEEFSKEHQFATIMLPAPLREKFAGLIQYEIIKVIEGCHYRNGIDSDHNKALNLAVEQIKQHFGVEE